MSLAAAKWSNACYLLLFTCSCSNFSLFSAYHAAETHTYIQTHIGLLHATLPDCDVQCISMNRDAIAKQLQ